MRTIMFVLIALSFSLFLVTASCPQEDTACFNQLEPSDLATSIQDGDITDLSQISSEQLAAALESSPEIVAKIPDADLTRSLNSNPSLITSSAKIHAELSNRVQNNPAILNNNEVIKKSWFSHYQIQDLGGNILMFDGQRIQTQRSPPTTFVIEDFPGATLLKDGCLQVPNAGIFCGSQDLKAARGPSGSILQTEGVPNYELVGGQVEIVTTNSAAALYLYCVDNSNLESCASVHLRVPQKSIPEEYRGNDVELVYRGQFRFFRGDKGDQIFTDVNGQEGVVERDVKVRISSGTEGFFYSSHIFKNAVIREPGDRGKGEFASFVNEFIVEQGYFLNRMDGTRVVFKPGEQGGELYYSEAKDPARIFCRQGASCLQNRPGSGKEYRSSLDFTSVQNNDQIEVYSPVYYDRVTLNNFESGEVNFVSTNAPAIRDEFEILGGFMAKEKGSVVPIYKMSEMRIGRADYFFEDEGKNLQHHFSTNHGRDLSVQSYFNSKHDGFVTCEVGIDCEERFAKSFGRVIRSPQGTVQDTIIIAGDTSHTAQTLRSHCKEVGCYILDSRDLPQQTTARNLIVAGHHYEGEDRVWRDPYERAQGQDVTHRPIDIIEYSSLPRGNNVHTVIFSACNSALEPTQDSSPITEIEILTQRFPNMQIIQGSDGKAPRYEEINELVDDKSKIPSNQQTHPNGFRSWLVKNGQSWGWTRDGKDYRVVN